MTVRGGRGGGHDQHVNRAATHPGFTLVFLWLFRGRCRFQPYGNKARKVTRSDDAAAFFLCSSFREETQVSGCINKAFTSSPPGLWHGASRPLLCVGKASERAGLLMQPASATNIKREEEEEEGRALKQGALPLHTLLETAVSMYVCNLSVFVAHSAVCRSPDNA